MVSGTATMLFFLANTFACTAQLSVSVDGGDSVQVFVADGSPSDSFRLENIQEEDAIFGTSVGTVRRNEFSFSIVFSLFVTPSLAEGILEVWRQHPRILVFCHCRRE